MSSHVTLLALFYLSLLAFTGATFELELLDAGGVTAAGVFVLLAVHLSIPSHFSTHVIVIYFSSQVIHFRVRDGGC